MRSSPALAAALLVGAGCFSTPGFSGARDGGGGDGGPGVVTPGPVTIVTTSSGGTKVESSYLTLEFENANWRMPVSLKSKITGNEELSSGGHGEDGIGFSLLNRYVVKRGEDPDSVGGSAMITVAETGPVRAVVRVTWDGNSPCGGSHMNANVIEFKVYMDGRIARHDQVNMTAMAGCTQPASAYTSVVGNRTLVTKFGADENTNLSPNAVSGEIFDKTTNPGWACLEGSGEAVGYGWTVPTLTPWETFELGRYATGNITFGFIYNDTTVLTSTQYVADTLLAIGQGSCAEMKARALEPYSTPAMLDGATWSPSDGAYLTLEGDVTATANLPAGAVFFLTDDASVPSLQIDHQPLQEDTDFVVQSAPGGALNGAMFYLKRPLMTNDVLTIGGN